MLGWKTRVHTRGSRWWDASSPLEGFARVLGWLEKNHRHHRPSENILQRPPLNRPSPMGSYSLLLLHNDLVPFTSLLDPRRLLLWDTGIDPQKDDLWHHFLRFWIASWYLTQGENKKRRPRVMTMLSSQEKARWLDWDITFFLQCLKW